MKKWMIALLFSLAYAEDAQPQGPAIPYGPHVPDGPNAPSGPAVIQGPSGPTSGYLGPSGANK